MTGQSGEHLAEKPGLAGKLSQTSAALEAGLLDVSSVSRLTGRPTQRLVFGWPPLS